MTIDPGTPFSDLLHRWFPTLSIDRRGLRRQDVALWPPVPPVLIPQLPLSIETRAMLHFDPASDMDPFVHIDTSRHMRRVTELIDLACLRMLYGNGGAHFGVLVTTRVDGLSVRTDVTLSEDVEPGTIAYRHTNPLYEWDSRS